MRRREFIMLIGGAALTWPLAGQAQNAPHVGWIFPGASAGNPTELAGFKEGLRELGYVEGRNIVVEYRFGENSVERLPEFATELARLNVSVIVALRRDRHSRRAARGAGHAYRVPLGRSDRRRASDQPEPARRQYHRRFVVAWGGKWPELAKQALPGLTRIGYLINPTNAASVATLNEARRSAEALGIDFRSYPVERPADLESAFAAMTRDGIGFLLLDAAHPYPTNWPRVAGLALGHKLPAISEIREFAFAGGLMSYGLRLFDMTRRMAHLRRQDSQRR